MMKISDPIMFGHCVTVYFKDVFEKFGEDFARIGVNPNNGLQDVYDKMAMLPEVTKKQLMTAIDEVYEKR